MGVLLTAVAAEMGSKAEYYLNKVCLFCGCRLGDPDPVHQDRTRAWHKPQWSGRVCAYCGVSKVKEHPTKTNEQLDTELKTNSETKKNFMDYVNALIDHYRAGHKTCHNVSTVPKESLQQESVTSMKSGVKGKVRLYSTYFPAKGDPRTNGLGHQYVESYRWKDGAYRLLASGDTPSQLV